MKVDLQTPSYQEQYRRILNHCAPPLYNDSERDKIIEPIKGQMIYNTDHNIIEYWNGSRWIK